MAHCPLKAVFGLLCRWDGGLRGQWKGRRTQEAPPCSEPRLHAGIQEELEASLAEGAAGQPPGGGWNLGSTIQMAGDGPGLGAARATPFSQIPAPQPNGRG